MEENKAKFISTGIRRKTISQSSLEKLFTEKAVIMQDEACMEGLKYVFRRFRIPRGYYSIGGYSEEALCIEKTEDHSWIVYSGERGNRYDKKMFDDVVSACKYMISEVAEDEAVNLTMQRYFDISVGRRKHSQSRRGMNQTNQMKKRQKEVEHGQM